MGQPITVVGSLNMDFVVQVAAFPIPGETVFGSGFTTIPGGKGGNQACAAARLGGRVRMVGRVGQDPIGEQLRSSLAAAGVDTSTVLVTPETSSGAAVIVVQAGGQNQIVVASGANALLSPADVSRALDTLQGGFLLLQLETPLETVEAAAATAHRLGATVILDPAPARPLPDTLLARVSCLTPNESEAMILLGRREQAVTLEEAPVVARALRDRGARAVLLKLGENGAFLDDGLQAARFPAPRVEAADATAAGDTFNGALAVALAEGRPIADAVRFANAAAAISVTRVGAQASIPTRAEVDASRSAD
jgi:ribokinase